MNDNEKDLQQDPQDIIVDSESAVDDTLADSEGSNFVSGDDWQFDAEAPSLRDDLSVENDEFEIALDMLDDSAPANFVSEDTPTEAFVQQITPPVAPTQPEPTEKPEAYFPTDAVQGSDEPPTDKKKKGKTIKIIVSAVAAVILVVAVAAGAIVYFTVPFGEDGKHLNPPSVSAKVDGEKVSLGMFEYYYSSLVSYYESYASYGYYDLDPNVDYSEQTTTDDDGNEVTWAEFFKKEALEELKNTTSVYYKALENDITLTANQKKTIDEQIESLKTTASEQTLSLEQYISKTFGQHCNEETIRLVLEQYYVTANYKGFLSAQPRPEQKEIDKYFNAHKDQFQTIEFSYLAVQFDAQDENAKAQAIKKAESYMPKMTDEKAVKSMVPEVYKDFIDQYVTEAMANDEKLDKKDAEKEALENFVQNTRAQISSSETPFDDETTKWIFDDSTNVGSTKYYVDEDYGFIYVILKTEPASVADDQTYSVRHILVMPEGADHSQGQMEFTDEQMAAAKKKAEKILKEYNDGEKTEYSFALLAEANSEDTASTSAGSNDMFGGLYEGVTLGQMVPSFEEWAVDKSRKYGDTGIVESEYGYHIMFFVNSCPQYQSEIIKAIRTEQADKLIEDSNIVINDSVVDKAISSYYKLKAEAAKEEAATAQVTTSQEASVTDEDGNIVPAEGADEAVDDDVIYGEDLPEDEVDD